MSVMELEVFHQGKARFVRRYNRCGKPKCWCAQASEREKRGRPGHGPYWYREYVRNGRVSRRYIGKNLPIGTVKGVD